MAEGPNVDNRSITIQESAVGSAIISGDGNTVYVIHQTFEQKTTDIQRSDGEIGPNPYKGLAAFKEEDADRYFGREAQVERLWKRFQELFKQSEAPRVLPILGPSGCGKSSLARAGLIPELARRPLPGKEKIRVAVLVPGTHPVEALAGVLAKAVTNDPLPVEKAVEFERVLNQRNDASLFDGLRKIIALIPGITDSPLVILVDQFEEVYSLCKDDKARQIFIDNLLQAASDNTGNVSIVLTLRSDFLGEAQQHGALDNVISSDWSIIVPAMKALELRRAIVEPARKFGSPLNEAVVDLLIKDTQEREGALPLLQFTLTRIWEEKITGKNECDTYWEMGGVGGAVAQKAQEIYDSLQNTDQAIAKNIFLSLIELGEGAQINRRRVSIRKLVKKNFTFSSVINILHEFSAQEARLLTLSGEEEQETAEVTHESLFSHWQQLGRWLDESRDDIRFQRHLEEAVDNWKKYGYPDGNLWQPPELDLLKSYCKRTNQNLTEEQQRFLKRSIRIHNNRQIVGAFGICLLAGLAGLATLLAISFKRAEQEALVRQLATQAEWLGYQSTGLYTTSALLAVEVAKEIPPKRTPPIEIDRALRSGLKMLPFFKFQVEHEGSVNSVAVSVDGSLIATAGDDKKVRLWNFSDGKPFKVFNHNGPVSSVAFNREGTQIIATDGKVARVWNIESGQEASRFENEGSINSVSLSPDGTMIATGDENNTIRVINILTGDEIASFNHNGRFISDVSFSHKGDRLATAGRDYSARVWDIASGDEVAHFSHGGAVFSIDFSPDDTKIVTGSHDTTARIWEIESGKEIARFEHESAVASVDFGDSSQLVVTATWAGTARLWDVANQRELNRFNHTSPETSSGLLSSAVFGPSDKTVITAGSDGTAKLWLVTDGEFAENIDYQNSVTSVVFSSDGEKLAIGGGGYPTVLWDVAENREIISFPHEHWVNAIAFGPDDKLLAILGNDNTLKVWNLSQGNTLESEFNYESLSIFPSMSFNPIMKEIATIAGKEIIFLDVQSNREVARLEHENLLSAITYSPDGKFLAISDYDGGLYIWELDTNVKRKLFDFDYGHNLASVVFNPDGTLIAASGRAIREGETIQVIQVSTGAVKIELFHEYPVSSLAFSPEGTTIGISSYGGIVRLWDIHTGLEKTRLIYDYPVESLAFSPDGRIIATAMSPFRTDVDDFPNRSKVKLSKLLHSDLMKEICARTSRNLTAFEWTTYLEKDLDSYELTCKHKPIHPSVLAQSKKYAEAGNIRQAISVYQQLKRLQPDIDLDPSTPELESNPRTLAQQQASTQQ